LSAVVDGQVIDLNRAVQLAVQPEGAIGARLLAVAEAAMPHSLGGWLARGTEARVSASETAIASANSLITERGLEWARSRLLVHELDTAKLAPPIGINATVFAVGLNYHDHAAEAGREPDEFPLIFSKPAGALRGYGDPIRIPAASHRIDYEGELVVVIGTPCHEVDEKSALDYVAGYTIGNDVSARDWQFRTREIMIGKAFDSFCPMGPWLVTADEIPDPHDLQLTTRVNGETRQDTSTAAMIFKIPMLVSYLSQVVTLQPGDAILTGTPAGIGGARKPRIWLRSGDVVEVSITGLGKLRNPVL
jgi:acylpyruvate hydrolase